MKKKTDKKSRSSPLARSKRRPANTAEKKPKSINSGAISASFEDIGARAGMEADLSARERFLQAIIDTEPE
jgi:hypothetical protein